jgi:riboflavin kinase/FMN adenylyltransferase
MIILRDSTPILPEHRGAVMALGNFDGLHLGHQAVIGKTVSLAAQLKKPAAIMTFEPHPYRLFRPEAPISRLLPFAEKARRLEGLGIDFIRVVHFTRAFSRTTAQHFIAAILHEQLQLSHVITGENFIFGHNREGHIDLLRENAAQFGIGATACPALFVGGERCSSTRVRTLLAEGNVREAASLLGRPHSITSRVRAGDQRGRTLGFPTANIWPGEIFMPGKGVYAVKGIIQGKTVNGVANLGTRPTFNGERLQLEVHFFDWNETIYGEKVEIAFIDRIRDEMKFSGAEALVKQIAEDSVKAKAILR